MTHSKKVNYIDVMIFNRFSLHRKKAELCNIYKQEMLKSNFFSKNKNFRNHFLESRGINLSRGQLVLPKNYNYFNLTDVADVYSNWVLLVNFIAVIIFVMEDNSNGKCLQNT